MNSCHRFEKTLPSYRRIFDRASWTGFASADRAVQRVLSKSRISVSNSTSLDGAGGAAFSGAFNLLIALIHRNSTQAMIRKLIKSVRKLPQARTAPCFFASTKAGAVTLDDSGMK